MSACPDNYRDIEDYLEYQTGFDKLNLTLMDIFEMASFDLYPHIPVTGSPKVPLIDNR